jgi:hypothetical protein
MEVYSRCAPRFNHSLAILSKVDLSGHSPRSLSRSFSRGRSYARSLRYDVNGFQLRALTRVSYGRFFFRPRYPAFTPRKATFLPAVRRAGLTMLYSTLALFGWSQADLFSIRRSRARRVWVNRVKQVVGRAVYARSYGAACFSFYYRRRRFYTRRRRAYAYVRRLRWARVTKRRFVTRVSRLNRQKLRIRAQSFRETRRSFVVLNRAPARPRLAYPLFFADARACRAYRKFASYIKARVAVRYFTAQKFRAVYACWVKHGRAHLLAPHRARYAKSVKLAEKKFPRVQKKTSLVQLEPSSLSRKQRRNQNRNMRRYRADNEKKKQAELVEPLAIFAKQARLAAEKFPGLATYFTKHPRVFRFVRFAEAMDAWVSRFPKVLLPLPLALFKSGNARGGSFRIRRVARTPLRRRTGSTFWRYIRLQKFVPRPRHHQPRRRGGRRRGRGRSKQKNLSPKRSKAQKKKSRTSRHTRRGRRGRRGAGRRRRRQRGRGRKNRQAVGVSPSPKSTSQPKRRKSATLPRKRSKKHLRRFWWGANFPTTRPRTLLARRRSRRLRRRHPTRRLLKRLYAFSKGFRLSTWARRFLRSTFWAHQTRPRAQFLRGFYSRLRRFRAFSRPLHKTAKSRFRLKIQASGLTTRLRLQTQAHALYLRRLLVVALRLLSSLSARVYRVRTAPLFRLRRPHRLLLVASHPILQAALSPLILGCWANFYTYSPLSVKFSDFRLSRFSSVFFAGLRHWVPVLRFRARRKLFFLFKRVVSRAKRFVHHCRRFCRRSVLVRAALSHWLVSQASYQAQRRHRSSRFLLPFLFALRRRVTSARAVPANFFVFTLYDHNYVHQLQGRFSRTRHKRKATFRLK